MTPNRPPPGPRAGEEPAFVLPAEPDGTDDTAIPPTELLDALPADLTPVSPSLPGKGVREIDGGDTPQEPRGETDETPPPAQAEASFDSPEVRIYRYNVYAMLVNACRYYKHKGLVVIVGLGLVPVAAVCAALLSFLLT
jgi:hypothetical protein